MVARLTGPDDKSFTNIGCFRSDCLSKYRQTHPYALLTMKPGYNILFWKTLHKDLFDPHITI